MIKRATRFLYALSILKTEYQVFESHRPLPGQEKTLYSRKSEIGEPKKCEKFMTVQLQRIGRVLWQRSL